MKTLSPLDAITQFVNAMNKGDLETALGLYEPGASLIAQPGVVATGTLALREALAGFVALKPTLTSKAHQVVEAGDVAQPADTEVTVRGKRPFCAHKAPTRKV